MRVPMTSILENENEPITTQNESIKEFVVDNMKVRTGMVKVSNGKSLPQPMRLYLSVDKLSVQKQEMCPFDTNELGDENVPGENEIRIVKIIRDENTGLGLSIKGGAEHSLPIMISQIFKDQAADKTGKLFVGDAIIKVNGEMIVHCTHDEAVNILRNAGDLIMLTVKYYRAATPFLKKEEKGKDGNDIKSGSDKTNSTNNKTLTLSKKWVDVTVVPLTMGYVTRYIYGTDKLRPNGFEIYGLNCIKSGIIFCDTPAILSQWLKYISDNISTLIQLEIRMYNRFCSAAERIEFMGWVNEGIRQKTLEINIWNAYELKFFAIKGSEVYFFENPPLKADDWAECGSVYKLYESQLKIIKETDVYDERQHCLLFTAVGNVVKYLSIETRQELLKMENAWNTSLCSAVRRLKEVKYIVNVGKPRVPAEFKIDWNYGYSLRDTQANGCIWRYRYSQLKGSSDDGISSLKLLFRDEKTGGIETREFESSSLELILYNMLAFAGSKFSLVDSKYSHPII